MFLTKINEFQRGIYLKILNNSFKQLNLSEIKLLIQNLTVFKPKKTYYFRISLLGTIFFECLISIIKKDQSVANSQVETATQTNLNLLLVLNLSKLSIKIVQDHRV